MVLEPEKSQGVLRLPEGLLRGRRAGGGGIGQSVLAARGPAFGGAAASPLIPHHTDKPAVQNGLGSRLREATAQRIKQTGVCKQV